MIVLRTGGTIFRRARSLGYLLSSRQTATFRAARQFGAMASHPNLVLDADEAIKIAGSAKTVAVLGIKTVAQASQAAYFVPEFLQNTGIDIIPVPVYYPEVKEILGKSVVRDLKEIKRPVDVLDVFRRPQDLPHHLDDILAMEPAPSCVWLQSGISNPEFELKLAEAGVKVVSNRCMKVDRTAAGFRARF